MCGELRADVDLACLSCVLATGGGAGTEGGLDSDPQPCVLCGSKMDCMNPAQCLAYSRCSINASPYLFPPVSFPSFETTTSCRILSHQSSAPLSTSCLGPVPQLLLDTCSSPPPHPAHPSPAKSACQPSRPSSPGPPSQHCLSSIPSAILRSAPVAPITLRVKSKLNKVARVAFPPACHSQLPPCPVPPHSVCWLPHSPHTPSPTVLFPTGWPGSILHRVPGLGQLTLLSRHHLKPGLTRPHQLPWGSCPSLHPPVGLKAPQL